MTAGSIPSPRRKVVHTESESNTSSARAEWLKKNTGAKSAPLLARDAAAFLHQSLSSPCVSTIAKAEGIWIEDHRWPAVYGFSRQQRSSHWIWAP